MTVLQNFYEETITASLSTGTVKMYVSGKPIADATSGWVVINPGNTSRREIVAFNAIGTDGSGDFIELSERGVGGTTEQTHEVGEPVRLNITAEHWAALVDLVDAAIPDSFIDTDGTLAADSDEKIPSQKAIKTYSDNTKIALAGNQDVNGVKTFINSPVVPEPTTDFQAATKKYADDIAVAGAPNAGLTTKGLVEISTDTEFEAGTAIGDTGAPLVPTNAQVVGLSITPSIQKFESNGTYTKPAGLKYIIIELVGGGGGGGGARITSQSSVGGAGGGGGYSKRIMLASELASTVTVTVGNGGTVGSIGSNPTDGGAGGTTQFGSYCQATGGNSGNGGMPEINKGGQGSGGDVNLPGGNGYGTREQDYPRCWAGDSQFGVGGMSVSNRGTGTDAHIDPTGYGSGGKGGYKSGGNSYSQGSTGNKGVVIITEYK